MLNSLINEKMKIAIIYDMIYPFNLGGIEIRNYEIARRLVKKGHEVHLFGVKLWKGKENIEIEGIKIHGVCRYNNLYSFAGTRKVSESFKFAAKIIRHLMKEDFDIIDVSTFPFLHCYTSSFAGFVKKTPVVFSWNGYFGDYWGDYIGGIKGFLGKIIERFSLFLVKNHVAVSETTKKDLIQRGIKEKNIKVIFNGVDLEKIRKIKFSGKKYDVIFVGRLAYQKNIELLIKSLKLISARKIRCCIVGEGPEEKKLKKLAKSLGISESIIFLGKANLEKVYQFMKSSKIFVLPSLWEGFGIVVIEANACGLPVITTNNEWNASKELIDGNGLVVENNPESLAKGIEKLLSDKRLLRKMSKNAVIKAKRFDWNDIADVTEEYYKSITKNF